MLSVEIQTEIGRCVRTKRRFLGKTIEQVAYESNVSTRFVANLEDKVYERWYPPLILKLLLVLRTLGLRREFIEVSDSFVVKPPKKKRKRIKFDKRAGGVVRNRRCRRH